VSKREERAKTAERVRRHRAKKASATVEEKSQATPEEPKCAPSDVDAMRDELRRLGERVEALEKQKGANPELSADLEARVAAVEQEIEAIEAKFREQGIEVGPKRTSSRFGGYRGKP
jgi:predicted  nucleic acid-binding Zn-ribbon protein